MLMFGVGAGSIGWMPVSGAVMAIEKNMPWGGGSATHGHSPDWQWAGYRGRIALLDLVTYQFAEGEFWYGPD